MARLWLSSPTTSAWLLRPDGWSTCWMAGSANDWPPRLPPPAGEEASLAVPPVRLRAGCGCHDRPALRRTGDAGAVARYLSRGRRCDYRAAPGYRRRGHADRRLERNVLQHRPGSISDSADPGW